MSIRPPPRSSAESPIRTDSDCDRLHAVKISIFKLLLRHPPNNHNNNAPQFKMLTDDLRTALSGISGSISLASWIVVLMPQLIENYRTKRYSLVHEC